RWLNLRKETSCYGLAPVVFRSISHFKRLFSQMPPAISSRVLMNPLMIFTKIIRGFIRVKQLKTVRFNYLLLGHK
ncbi:TPA: hypothetical protein ACM38N_004936, partial [Escherichia coli]